MKRASILSLIIICIFVVIGKVSNDWMLIVKLCGILGLICICIAGILNGAFISGDRNRANFSSDSIEGRSKKSNITNWAVIIGLPNIILAAIIYFVM